MGLPRDIKVMSTAPDIELKLCETVESLQGCVDMQRRVFDLPEIELSPIRHFIVTMHAGGFTLGAFHEGRLIGFCLSVPALLNGARALYSHMTAVEKDYQGFGIGSRLKWEQRRCALERGIQLVKWTFQPEKSLNAFFNLEKLGAVVTDYMPDFYGNDYGVAADSKKGIDIQSDRLFALWRLNSRKVIALSSREQFVTEREPAAELIIPGDWAGLVLSNRDAAALEQQRIRTEFQEHFSGGLICEGFVKDVNKPKYLFYRD